MPGSEKPECLSSDAGLPDARWPVADASRKPADAPGLNEAAARFVGHAEVEFDGSDRARPGLPFGGAVGDPLRRRGAGKIGVRLHRVGGADLILPDLEAIPRPLRDRSVKRALDLALAALGLVALSPLLAIIAVLLVAGGGPVLFAQPRVGRGRVRFTCYKFRSMHRSAQDRLAALLVADPRARREWDVYQKLGHDPRTTRFGRLLRATSLDELPQLVNVVRGEMSLVGPRPVVAPEVAGYPADRAYYESGDFDDYAGCTPGITGLWQISGRHRTAHADRVRLDRWYARNWSVVLDIVILWRTVRVVLGRSGA